MKSVVRDGRGMPRVEDVPRPAPRSGHVLVRTCASLVSAGTERAATEFAGLSLGIGTLYRVIPAFGADSALPDQKPGLRTSPRPNV